MLNQRAPSLRRRGQAGLSIVELMVGIAIGLIVVAASTMVVATQLGENRRLLLETQLQQDLRATADIITRELRRAGALPDVRGASVLPLSVQTVWSEGTLTTATPAQYNPAAAALALNSSSDIEFDYVASDTTYIPGPYGFRLNNGVIQTRLSGSSTTWQPLTDINVMRVTAFNIGMAPPGSASAVRVPCPNLCPGTNDTACWPRAEVRELLVSIEGVAARDANVRRAVTTRVRVRADRVPFFNPTLNQICPP